MPKSHSMLQTKLEFQPDPYFPDSHSRPLQQNAAAARSSLVAGHSEGERGSGCKTGTPGVRSRGSRRDPAMSGRAELTPSCLETEGSRLFLHMNAEPGLSPLYVPARPPRQGKNELSVPSWLSVRSRAGQARVRASRGCCGCQGPGRKVRGLASTAGPPSSI